MNRIYTFLTVCCIAIVVCMCSSSQAQQANAGAASMLSGDAYCTPLLYAPLVGERNVPSEDLNWQPVITTKEFEHENPSPDEELLERIKAEKLRQK